MRAILQNAFELLKEKESNRGIVRFFVPSEIAYVRDVDKFAMIKNGKATIPSLKQKAIRQGLNLYGETELLRVALEKEIERVLKRKRLRDNCNIEPISYLLPAIAKRGTYENVAYIDIKSCFYSIYSVVGLDVRCKTKKDDDGVSVLSVGRGLLTRCNSELVYVLKDFKRERNSIVGLMSSCFTLVYKSGRFERQFFRSNVLNLELRAYICCLLNALVGRFKEHVIYWNVDGGFLYPEGVDHAVNVLNDYGFEVRVVGVKWLDVTCIGGYSWIDEDGVIHTSGHYRKKGKDVFNIMRIKNSKEFLKWVKRLI